LHLCAEQLSKDAVQSRLHPQQGGDLL
jgi:hypothetical protein